MRKRIRIVVIDSGVSNKFENLNRVESGVYLQKDTEHIKLTKDVYDETGHGTAISNIILTECKDAYIYPVKIVDRSFFTDEETLICALEYVYNNISCDIINMSLGISICEQKSRLQDILRKLKEKNVIIVSAFNNDGSMSYPALMDEVIGVDSSARITDIYKYEFVENSPINIFAMGKNQRVLWLDGKKIIAKGSSFAAAHVSATIGRLLEDKSVGTIEEELKKHAVRVIHCEETIDHTLDFAIKKVIVFPYNKEMHSVVRFYDSAKYTLAGVYDLKESGNVGKIIKTDSDNVFEIQNYLNIDWDSDFETIILGHTNEIQKVMRKNIREYFVLKSRIHHKNIYSFDYISQEEISNEMNIYCPYVNKFMVPQNKFGKLYRISKPVLGFFGTGSKQGKFTLQMILKRKFEEDGYNVGHIGSEPSALFMGCQKCYPMGYENSVEIKGYDAINTLNSFLFDIEDDSDIIMVGSQSNTIPPIFGNEAYYTMKQLEFLMGTEPDAVILTCSAHDDLEYVSRTIRVIENIVETKVIAIVLFPQKLTAGWSTINNVMEDITDEDVILFKDYFDKNYSIPLFELDRSKDIEKLYMLCNEYFTHEE